MGLSHRKVRNQMQIEDKRFKHGCAKRNSSTRLYRVWQNMRTRCNNSHSKEYKYYGQRGISVCEEWNNFSIFQEWAYNNGYKEDAKRGECTLDRIDVNGNYEPSNCRWVDMKSQCQNRRMWGTDTHNHKMIIWEYNGEKHTIKEWSEITGIDNKILRTRKHKGWNIERILTTPPIK